MNFDGNTEFISDGMIFSYAALDDDEPRDENSIQLKILAEKKLRVRQRSNLIKLLSSCQTNLEILEKFKYMLNFVLFPH